MHTPQDCTHALELPTGVKETCWKDHLKFLSLWQWKVKSECKSELIRCISCFLQKLLLFLCGCSKPRNYVSFLLWIGCTHNNRHVENLVKPREFSGLVRQVWGETLTGFWQQSFRRQTNHILKHLGHFSTSSRRPVPVRQGRQITAKSQRAVNVDAHGKTPKSHFFQFGQRGWLAEENTRLLYYTGSCSCNYNDRAQTTEGAWSLCLSISRWCCKPPSSVEQWQKGE